MAKALTALTVKNMKPDPVRRQEIADPALTGLYLVIQPTGKKSWACRYRHEGKPKKLTLGRFPVMSLSAARQAASVALEQVELGIDPAPTRTADAAPTPDDPNKVSTLLPHYLRDHVAHLRRADETARILNRFFAPFGDRDVRSFTRKEMRGILMVIARRGMPTARVHKSAISSFFRWCMDQDILEANPVSELNLTGPKEQTRDRVLTDREIQLLWSAADKVQPWGCYSKMLLLTGQRRSEIAEMAREELQGDVLHLAPERTKNGRGHSLSLSSAAMAVLESVPRVSNEYWFSTNGRTPISGFKKGLDALHAEMTTLANEGRSADQPPVVIPHWTWHDLRRTVATGMARLAIPVRVTESVLNHVGTASGLVEIYQRHDYADEKRNALSAWANHVMNLVSGKPTDNVVVFRHG